MRQPLKAGIAALAAASVITTGTSVAYAGGDHDRHGTKADRDRHDKHGKGHGHGRGDGQDDLRVVGLASDGTKLVRFDSDQPRDVSRGATVTGLTGGDTALVGIDHRVQDGDLYGVGDNSAAAGIYRLDAKRGTATEVARLTVPLEGATFGVDFNPAANALRIISDTGQNLRQSFVDFPATVVDGTLTYPPATPTAVGVNGAAYTNNDLDPDTATTLFDLDTAMDQVALQSPANAGTLAATGMLGVDAKGDTGFDIHSTLRGGTTVDLTGLAAIDGYLYEVALLTGDVDSLGRIGASVTDIAIPLDQR